jgi:hypothetical protein
MNVAKEPLGDPSNQGNFEMNDEQYNFIFKYYPEFGAAPYEMMVWLYGESKKVEDMNNAAYSKPGQGGMIAGEEDNSFNDNKYDKGFDKKGKQQNKKDSKVNAEAIREAQ